MFLCTAQSAYIGKGGKNMEQRTKSVVYAVIVGLLCAAVFAGAAAAVVLKNAPEQYKEVNAEQTLSTDGSEITENVSEEITNSESVNEESSAPAVTEPESSTAEASVPSNAESSVSESVTLTGAKTSAMCRLLPKSPNFPPAVNR